MQEVLTLVHVGSAVFRFIEAPGLFLGRLKIDRECLLQKADGETKGRQTTQNVGGAEGPPYWQLSAIGGDCITTSYAIG